MVLSSDLDGDGVGDLECLSSVSRVSLKCRAEEDAGVLLVAEVAHVARNPFSKHQKYSLPTPESFYVDISALRTSLLWQRYVSFF